MSTPTRFKNGLNNAQIGVTLANLPNPTAIQSFEDFQDFNQFVAGDWTVTNTSSHNTIGLVAGQGGVLKIVGGSSTVSTNVGAIQKKPLNFNFSASQQVWFETSLSVDKAANNLLVAGITSSNATVAPSDGIYFKKADGSASVDLVISASSTATTISGVATLADATVVRLGFYYDGNATTAGTAATLYVFVNDTLVARTTTMTNLPTATDLAPGIAMKMGATAPTTAYVSSDFIFAAQDRTNP